MVFSQPDIIVAQEKAPQETAQGSRRPKKKGPDLAVWACKSTLRGGGGDNQWHKYLVTPRAISIGAMISV
jgi:hypothetical protein